MSYETILLGYGIGAAVVLVTGIREVLAELRDSKIKVTEADPCLLFVFIITLSWPIAVPVLWLVSLWRKAVDRAAKKGGHG